VLQHCWLSNGQGIIISSVLYRCPLEMCVLVYTDDVVVVVMMMMMIIIMMI